MNNCPCSLPNEENASLESTITMNTQENVKTSLYKACQLLQNEMDCMACKFSNIYEEVLNTTKSSECSLKKQWKSMYNNQVYTILSKGLRLGMSRFRCMMLKYTILQSDKDAVKNIEGSEQYKTCLKYPDEYNDSVQLQVKKLDVKKFCRSKELIDKDNFFKLDSVQFQKCVDGSNSVEVRIQKYKDYLYHIAGFSDKAEIQIVLEVSQGVTNMLNRHSITYEGSGKEGIVITKKEYDEIFKVVLDYENYLLQQFARFADITIFMTTQCKDAIYYYMTSLSATTEDRKQVINVITSIEKESASIYGLIKDIQSCYIDSLSKTTDASVSLDNCLKNKLQIYMERRRALNTYTTNKMIRGGGFFDGVTSFASSIGKAIVDGLSKVNLTTLLKLGSRLKETLQNYYSLISCTLLITLIIALIGGAITAAAFGMVFAVTIVMLLMSPLLIITAKQCSKAINEAYGNNLDNDNDTNIESKCTSDCTPSEFLNIVFTCTINAKTQEDFIKLKGILNSLCKKGADMNPNDMELISELSFPIKITKDTNTKIKELSQMVKDIVLESKNTTTDLNIEYFNELQRLLEYTDYINVIFGKMFKSIPMYKLPFIGLTIIRFMKLDRLKSKNPSLHKIVINKLLAENQDCSNDIIQKINMEYNRAFKKQEGGIKKKYNKKQNTIKKTREKTKHKNKTYQVYVGPRGGRYILINGKFKTITNKIL